MCRKLFVFLLVLLGSYSCTDSSKIKNELKVKNFISSLSTEEIKLLEDFFRMLVGKKALGYVLFGEKPIFVWDQSKNKISLRKQSLLFKKGVRLWEKFNVLPDKKKYFINPMQRMEPNSNSVLFINKAALQKIINENLSLFRYVLGCNITAKNLVEDFTNPEKGFMEITKYNRTLIGIVLGYGTDNSLLVSREEDLSQYLNSFEDIPLNSKKTRESQDKNWDKELEKLERVTSLFRGDPLLPKYGYSSLQSELQDLKSKTTVFWKLYKRDPVRLPWFACVEKSFETKALLKRYTEAQQKIGQVLDSPNFLEQILYKLFETIDGEIEIPTISKETNSSEIPEDLSKAIAINTLNFLEDTLEFMQIKYQEDFKTSYLKGVKEGINGQKGLSSGKEMIMNGIELINLQKQFQSQKNLKKAYEVLENSKDYNFIVPQKVAILNLQDGEGERTINENSQISFTSKILNWYGLAKDQIEGITSIHKNVHFKDLLPGIGEAVKGMKKGGKRRILIHPDWAYSDQGNLESHVAFEIFIEIENIDLKEYFKDTPKNIYNAEVEELKALTIKHRESACKYFYELGLVRGEETKKEEKFLCPSAVLKYMKETKGLGEEKLDEKYVAEIESLLIDVF